MGIIFLVVLGAGVGSSTLYWIHGSDIKGGFTGKLIKQAQEAMDKRQKDRGQG